MLLRVLILLFLFVQGPSYAFQPPFWLPSCGGAIARVGSPTLDYYKDEFLYRSHVINGQAWHEVLVVEEYPLEGSVVTRVVRREVRKGPPTPGLSGNNGSGKVSNSFYNELRKWHLDLAKSVVNLTVDKYEKRRNWGPEFRKKLTNMAEEYLNDSVYVVITDKATNTVVGGKRYILAPYGFKNGQLVADGMLVEKHYGPVAGFREPGAKIDPNDQSLPKPPKTLPEADYLGIDLPRGSVLPEGETRGIKTGMQVEIGALVVEETLPKDLRGKIWADLHLQDLRMAFDGKDDLVNYKGISFHAYADPVSRKMYLNDLNWGWELLNGYHMGGHQMTFLRDKDAPEIEKEGTKWVPIIFHPERMEDYHNRFVRGTLPRSENVDLGSRQRDLGQTLGGAEVVESFEALIRGFNSEHGDVVAASAVGLIRLAHRQDLLEKKRAEAEADPSRKWQIAGRAEDRSDIPQRIDAVMQAFLKKNQSGNKKVVVLAMVGQMLELGISQPPLDRNNLLNKYLIPTLGNSSLAVRATSLAHLQMHFTPAEVATALSALKNTSGMRRKAEADLRRGRIHTILISEIEAMMRRWSSHREQLGIHVNPTAVLEWMAEVSDRLAGDYKEPSPYGSQALWDDMVNNRVDGLDYSAWGSSVAAQLKKELNSEQASTRMKVALTMRMVLDAKIELPGLTRAEALRQIFMPLVADKDPLVARHALFQMYGLYEKPELKRILIGNRKVESVRGHAIETLDDARVKRSQRASILSRFTDLWRGRVDYPLNMIARLADTLPTSTAKGPDVLEAFLILSISNE